MKLSVMLGKKVNLRLFHSLLLQIGLSKILEITMHVLKSPQKASDRPMQIKLPEKRSLRLFNRKYMNRNEELYDEVEPVMFNQITRYRSLNLVPRRFDERLSSNWRSSQSSVLSKPAVSRFARQ